MFLAAIEYIVTILFLVFMITQVIVPILQGTLAFPLFRKRKNAVLDELEAAQDVLEDAKTIKKIKKVVEKTKEVFNDELPHFPKEPIIKKAKKPRKKKG